MPTFSDLSGSYKNSICTKVDLDKCLTIVDRFDQNISLYSTGIREKNLYVCLFKHCIDLPVQNSWQPHRRSEGRFDQLAFRRRIATSILQCNTKAITLSLGRQSQRKMRLDGMHQYVIGQGTTNPNAANVTSRLDVKNVMLVSMFVVMLVIIQMVVFNRNVLYLGPSFFIFKKKLLLEYVQVCYIKYICFNNISRVRGN